MRPFHTSHHIARTAFPVSWALLCGSIAIGLAAPLSAARHTGEPEIQSHPLSPEEALRSFRVEEGLRIELVASEPLTADPVDLAFDEFGRMFVVENLGYNRSPEARPRSRIRRLEDLDGDGRMDRATTFAEDLDYAQGVLAARGGLIVTTNTAILFLRDTDGDGRADQREVIFECTPSINIDRQMSAPRRALDNWIYFNLGLFKKELWKPGEPDRRLGITTNFRYHPGTKAFEPASGAGQFGKAFDDWGREFFSMNRNPALFAVLPYRYLERNPAALLTRGDEDVAPAGGEGKVYPLQNFRTTSSAHAGTFTAACGTGVYRGDLLGREYANNLFVCEPTAALVTRWILEPNGASLRARRAHPGREFLASTDEWFRPVNVVTGPDGALYVVDMYRRFIDGARFFPDDYVAANDMGAGTDRGRIYRIVPAGAERIRPFAPLPIEPTERVALLEHPNGWQRDTAQRLLVEAGDAAVLPAVERLFHRSSLPQGRLHALWTIEGLNRLNAEHLQAALQDPEPGVIENALWLAPRFIRSDRVIRQRVLALTDHAHGRIRFAALLAAGELDHPEAAAAFVRAGGREAEDAWMRAAILSSPLTQSGEILSALLHEPAFTSREARGPIELVGGLAAVLAARGQPAGLAPVLDTLSEEGAAPAGHWWRMAVVSGIAEGLRRQQAGSLPKTLSALLSDPPAELAGSLRGLRQAVNETSGILKDRTRPLSERGAAIALFEHLPKDETAPLVATLLDRREPVAIQQAMLDVLGRLDRRTITPVLYDHLDQMGGTARTGVIQYLQGNQLELLQRIKAGRLNPALIDAAGRWNILNSNREEIRTLGREIFGQAERDRKGLVRRYAAALAGPPGSAARGHTVFLQTCATCHRFRGEGQDIGPDISDVRIKTPEMLLSDILDPNGELEPRWEAYSLTDDSGRNVVGIITSETNEAIVVKSIGGTETLARASLRTYEPLGVSLMPPGLEASLNEQAMADLLAFLRSVPDQP